MKSLYESLGGPQAVDAVVETFYRKVLVNDQISHFFETTDMDGQIAKQKAFLTMAFGGPHQYSGGSMREAHLKFVKQGLNDTHFDTVVTLLANSLRDHAVNEELINSVKTIAESTRHDVLNR